ncbi:MAG: hypothetical protein AAF750_11440 [Planctomycetota bacterium]
MSELIRRVNTDHEVIEPAAPPAPPTPFAPPALPAPRGGSPITIREGVLSDYSFIDALQKANSKAVGFMWEKAIKGHIEKGNVLVAESVEGAGGKSVGYVLGVDRYLKRDELGIIYQMNVAPGSRRSLVGANLLKAKFERSAYGCRLYCCWCAQDLAANRFWEAMGFVPLAFRTGGGRPRKNSRSKKQPRMHIFWQKRIRPREWDAALREWVEDDYPYWFPSQTGAGAIGEDRLVLPIPPGTHWSDAKPIVLPEGPRPREGGDGASGGEGEVLMLEHKVEELERERKAMVKQKKAAALKLAGERDTAQRTVKRGGLRFGPATPSPAAREAEQEAEAAVDAELKAAKKAVRAAKRKFDPAQEAFARELKDRWLEHVAERPGLLLAAPKYDVTRRVERYGGGGPGGDAGEQDGPAGLLDAA